MRPIIRLHGDREAGKAYVSEAKKVLYHLKENIRLGGITTNQFIRDFSDGTRIIAQSFMGIDILHILTVPVVLRGKKVVKKIGVKKAWLYLTGCADSSPDAGYAQKFKVSDLDNPLWSVESDDTHSEQNNYTGFKYNRGYWDFVMDDESLYYVGGDGNGTYWDYWILEKRDKETGELQYVQRYRPTVEGYCLARGIAIIDDKLHVAVEYDKGDPSYEIQTALSVLDTATGTQESFQDIQGNTQLPDVGIEAYDEHSYIVLDDPPSPYSSPWSMEVQKRDKAGNLVWATHIDGPSSKSIYGLEIRVDSSGVYVGYEVLTGHSEPAGILKLSHDGTEAWRQGISGVDNDGIADLALSSSKIFGAIAKASSPYETTAVVCFAKEDGEVLWQTDLPEMYSRVGLGIAYYDGKVYIGGQPDDTADGMVIVLKASTGEKISEHILSGYGGVRGQVYKMIIEGKVIAIETTSGDDGGGVGDLGNAGTDTGTGHNPCPIDGL